MDEIPTGHIRYRMIDGRVVVLDLRAANYVVMDDTASRMWCAFVDRPDRQACIQHIALELGLPEAECERELDAFVAGCRARGYLRRADETLAIDRLPEYVPRLAGVSIFHAWRCIVATRRCLAQRGFEAAYAYVQALSAHPVNANAASLQSALSAFRRAENLVAVADASIDCLPRSLALHRFLRSTGFDAMHVIGVRRFPFGAHAWVEVSGTVVCDSEVFVSQYTELSRG